MSDTVNDNTLQLLDISSEINPKVIAESLNKQTFTTKIDETFEDDTGILNIKNIDIKMTPKILPGQIRVIISPIVIIIIDKANVEFHLSAQTNVFTEGRITASGLLRLSFNHQYKDKMVNFKDLWFEKLQSPQLCPDYPDRPGFCNRAKKLLNDNMNESIRKDIDLLQYIAQVILIIKLAKF